jgi:hypothetical protein
MEAVMSERTPDGYFTEVAGHLWKDTRGPDAACERCGLGYPSWSGDRCWKAPDCTAMRGDIQCSRESGHEGEHWATVTW